MEVLTQQDFLQMGPELMCDFVKSIKYMEKVCQRNSQQNVFRSTANPAIQVEIGIEEQLIKNMTHVSSAQAHFFINSANNLHFFNKD